MGNGVEKSRAAVANPSFLSPSDLPDPVQRVAEATVPFFLSSSNGPSGSGVFVSYEGNPFLLTVAHNLRTFGKNLYYQLPSGFVQVLPEDILYSGEPGNDFAVIKLPSNVDLNDLKPANLKFDFGPNQTLPEIFVLGYPNALPNAALVASVCHDVTVDEELMVRNCEILPGMSGGPWVDQDGNVFGLSQRTYQVGAKVEAAWAVPLGIEAVRKGLETAVAKYPHEKRWELGTAAHITQVDDSDVLASPSVNFSYDWLQDFVSGSSSLDLRTGIAASYVNWPQFHGVSVIGTVEPRIDLRGVIEIGWLLGAGTVFTKEERGVAGLFQFRFGLPITPDIAVAAAAGFEMFHTKQVDQVVSTFVPELTYRF